jgi:hypothetical protein
VANRLGRGVLIADVNLEHRPWSSVNVSREIQCGVVVTSGGD